MKRFWKVSAAVLMGATITVLGLTGVASAKSLLPKITHVTPNSGSTAGYTTVHIKGKNLSTTNLNEVSFGGADATGCFVVNSGNIQCTTPPSATTGDVYPQVTTLYGTTDNTTVAFDYVTTPVIQHIGPNEGPTEGAQVVTIAGSNFTGATAVDFGTVAALSYAVDSDSTITAVTPPQGAGKVQVTVTGPSGTSPIDTGVTGYTYVAHLPVVSSVAPDFGLWSGGQTVTVTGLGFERGTVNYVAFGSVDVTSGITVDSNSQLTVVAPASASGDIDSTVDVQVDTSNGLSPVNAPQDYFYYLESYS